MSYWHELEREYTEVQKALIAMTAEKERCRQLAVEWSLKADGYRISFERCENMKLAREFEDLLQTTSIPVAVEKVKELIYESEQLEKVKNVILVSIMKELKQAKADNAALLSALWQIGGDTTLWQKSKSKTHYAGLPAFVKKIDDIKKRPHPGADILKEIEQYKRALELACEEFEPEDCQCCSIYDDCPNTGERESIIDCPQRIRDYFLDQSKAGEPNA